MKKYNAAPLPFMGQKRKFLKEFKKALNQYSENAIYVDLFGGSGLLAHTVKREYPNAKVIYNDFDNYSQRIAAIDQTNELLSKIRLITNDLPKDKRILEDPKKAILNLVKKAEEHYGYVDYITISSSLLFSMKYVLNYTALTKSTLYNCVRQSDYDANGYFDDLEIVSLDYRKLYDLYKGIDNVVFLVDPPYLQTNVSTYKNYWSLSDYLDVLDVLDNNQYFYFTSNKSSIIELCEWVSNKTSDVNPFEGATRKDINTTVNYNSSYTDIMLFKR